MDAETDDDDRPCIRCLEGGSMHWTLFTDDEQRLCFANCLDCPNVYFIGDSIQEIETKYRLPE
jgi:hypothetical protein